MMCVGWGEGPLGLEQTVTVLVSPKKADSAEIWGEDTISPQQTATKKNFISTAAEITRQTT